MMKLMKLFGAKTLLAILLLNSFHTKSEANCCDPCHPFDGFYVGVNVGEAINTDHLRYGTLLFSIQTTADSLFNVYDTQLYNARPYGEINLGWGRQWCSFLYLGLRAGVNFSSHRHSQTNASIASVAVGEPELDIGIVQNSTIKTKFNSVEPTIDLKAGFVWNRTLLFALLGAAFNRERVQLESVGQDQLDDVIVTEAVINDNFSRRQAAFHWGLGIEHFLCDCISIQALYTHTHYRKISDRAAALEGDTEIGVFEFSSRPNRQVFSVGLAYYF